MFYLISINQYCLKVQYFSCAYSVYSLLIYGIKYFFKEKIKLETNFEKIIIFMTQNVFLESQKLLTNVLFGTKNTKLNVRSK